MIIFGICFFDLIFVVIIKIMDELVWATFELNCPTWQKLSLLLVGSTKQCAVPIKLGRANKLKAHILLQFFTEYSLIQFRFILRYHEIFRYQFRFNLIKYVVINTNLTLLKNEQHRSWGVNALSYETHTLFELGLFMSDMYRLGYQHDTNIYDYIKLCYFLKWLSMLIMCMCFIGVELRWDHMSD
jgi:uncharacterized membrane protein